MAKTSWAVFLMTVLQVVLAYDNPCPRRIESMDYPRMAVLSGTQGVVVVRCDVRDDGSLVPKNAEGPPVLSDAVRANVVKWKFFSSNSGDTSSSVTLIYTFEIKGASRKSSPESRFIFEFPNRVYVSSEQPYVMPTGAEKR